MSPVVQEGISLGDLLGAHDVGDFLVEVCGASPVMFLERGDILAKVAGTGHVTIVGEGQAAREEDTSAHFRIGPRLFDVHSFLRNTGERNYCLSLFLGEKGKLIKYLDERGAMRTK